MWTVRNIEFRPVELDFRSSGQGRHSSTAVHADGERIVGALSLTDLRGGPIQTVLCGHCGSAGCKPGDWVCLRRLGEGLVVIPSFSAMEGSPGPEHQPPDFINQKGAVFIGGEALRALRTGADAFRNLDRWPRLTAREFARLVQWEAPAHVLGTFPSPPRLRREFVIGLDPGEQGEVMSALDDVLDRAFASNEPVALGRGDPVSFYIDLPGIVEWVSLAFDRGTVMLANGPDWIVSSPDDK